MPDRRSAALLFGTVLLASVTTSVVADPRQASAKIGAAITPDFARELYEEIAPMREADGCRLTRFDTVRFSITVGLTARDGSEHSLEMATTDYAPEVGRIAGGWALRASESLDALCPQTTAAIERELGGTATPRGAPWRADRWTSVRANYPLIAGCFLALLVWSGTILYREVREHRPPRSALVSLATIGLAAFALRWFLSPHTFLHEYYHIAETLYGHLWGETGPVYGDTGPALFQLLGRLLGIPDEPAVIFATNALIASLAIPAIALFELEVMRSWSRALTAALLLCVLPHHLRFSSSEVLFVQSVTFGLWTLWLFALYLRTAKWGDALCGILALSLAMQTRPEMLLFPAALVGFAILVDRKAWRILLDRRTWAAFGVLLLLLIPRFFEIRQVLNGESQPGAALPPLHRYVESLILLDPSVTPTLILGLGIGGWLVTALRKPGYALWMVGLYGGFTLFSLSLFDNHPYNVRSQLLPTSFIALAAAGVASLWTWLWRRRQAAGKSVGGAVLVAFATAVVVGSANFVTELRDQQLEWAFLERTVPRLPEGRDPADCRRGRWTESRRVSRVPAATRRQGLPPDRSAQRCRRQDEVAGSFRPSSLLSGDVLLLRLSRPALPGALDRALSCGRATVRARAALRRGSRHHRLLGDELCGAALPNRFLSTRRTSQTGRDGTGEMMPVAARDVASRLARKRSRR